jgi:hypothetical protein
MMTRALLSDSLRSAASSRPVRSGFASVGGLGDYGDVRFKVEQRGERAAQHGLVFGEKNADGGFGPWRLGGCVTH